MCVLILFAGRIAEWHLATYPDTTREHLAMVPVLMSYWGSRNPLALAYKKPVLTLDDVLRSPNIAPCTNLYECARRTDGGAAFIVASNQWLDRQKYSGKRVGVVGGAEVCEHDMCVLIFSKFSYICER